MISATEKPAPPLRAALCIEFPFKASASAGGRYEGVVVCAVSEPPLAPHR